jgi:hypothetical protein
MNAFGFLSSILMAAALSTGTVAAQQQVKLGDNAALRYWSAFAQMQDSAITDQQAKELAAILDGSVPYDDLKYKDLVEKNRPALETMIRATALPSCDWGLDYPLGSDLPQDYIRKSLALGRLNVLYAFHLLITGDKDGAARVLVGGLRFSHDVGNGGSFFATLVAKNLLATHLRAMDFALRMGALAAPQRSALLTAVAKLGPDGLDWQLAARRDLESLRSRYSHDPQASAALTRIISSYVDTLGSPSKLSTLQKVIADAPQPVSELIPNPKRMLDEKQDLSDRLRMMRSSLQ